MSLHHLSRSLSVITFLLILSDFIIEYLNKNPIIFSAFIIEVLSNYLIMKLTFFLLQMIYYIWDPKKFFGFWLRHHFSSGKYLTNLNFQRYQRLDWDLLSPINQIENDCLQSTMLVWIFKPSNCVQNSNYSKILHFKNNDEVKIQSLLRISQMYYKVKLLF